MATASLQAHDTYFFNVDPNSITWQYSLNTKVTDTYGGKVVQILSINWDNLVVDFEMGSAGREGLREFASFFKDALAWQKATKEAAIFSFPPRAYVIACYLSTFTLKDELKNASFPFSFKAKIQRDVMGNVRSDIYANALGKLVEGVGWSKNTYTYNGAETITTTTQSTSSNQSTTGDVEFVE